MSHRAFYLNSNGVKVAHGCGSIAYADDVASEAQGR
jgi:hypothetical protein